MLIEIGLHKNDAFGSLVGQIVYPQEGPEEEYLGTTRRTLRTPGAWFCNAKQVTNSVQGSLLTLFTFTITMLHCSNSQACNWSAALANCEMLKYLSHPLKILIWLQWKRNLRIQRGLVYFEQNFFHIMRNINVINLFMKYTLIMVLFYIWSIMKYALNSIFHRCKHGDALFVRRLKLRPPVRCRRCMLFLVNRN